jgi:hypothetical protein
MLLTAFLLAARFSVPSVFIFQPAPSRSRRTNTDYVRSYIDAVDRNPKELFAPPLLPVA